MKVVGVVICTAIMMSAAGDAHSQQTQQTQQAQQTQHGHVAVVVSDSAARFLDAAKRNAERYRDRRVAIAEGFRQIGPDMPGMGEHWMQPGRMVSGRFNAAEPAVLTYITIAAEPVLTGVAFVLPLQPRQPPPDFPNPAAWHAHGGTVDEELLVALGSHGVDAMAASGVRLAMLHAWVFTDNPDGPFAGNNWGLPFVRLGLAPPRHPDPRAAHALSLAAGGTAYYANLFRLTRALNAADEAAAGAALADAETAVKALLASEMKALLASERRALELLPGALHSLSVVWGTLWLQLSQSVSPEGYAALTRFR